MSIDEIFPILQKLVAEQFAKDFDGDLGADSVDLVELVMAMEEEFEVGETDENDLNALKTVGDAVNYIADRLNK